MMKDPSGAAIVDPNARLLAFLSHFDLLEFNSLPMVPFHCFAASYSSFLHFSMPTKGLPLLEELVKVQGDFTAGFRGGVFLGIILLQLLCLVLVSLKSSSLNSFSEEKLLEWRRVV